MQDPSTKEQLTQTTTEDPDPAACAAAATPDQQGANRACETGTEKKDRPKGGLGPEFKPSQQREHENGTDHPSGPKSGLGAARK